MVPQRIGALCKNLGYAAAIASLALGFVFYLTALDYSPAPFFVDEVLVSAEVIKVNWGLRPLELLIRHGHSSEYFSYLPYIAFSSALTKVVGSSIYSLRLSSAICAILTGAVIFCLSCEIGLPKKYSLLATIFYWLMPPVIVQSRIAWDPALFPLISTTSILFLEKSFGQDAGFAGNTNRWSRRFISGILCGTLVGLVSWTYPPGKLCSILLIATYSVICIGRDLHTNSWNQSRYWLWLSTFLSVSSGLVGWLLLKSFQTNGAETRGYKELILGQENLLHKIGIRFFQNITNLDYLLLQGDLNARHSLPEMGTLGIGGFIIVVSILAYILRGGSGNSRTMAWVSHRGGSGIFKCFSWIVVFSAPSLLGNTVTHSLRACGSFPFWSILAAFCTSYIVTQLRSSFKRDLAYLVIATVALVSTLHLSRYTLGGFSFLDKGQLKGPETTGSSYPGISRRAFGYEAYREFQEYSNEEICQGFKNANDIPEIYISYSEAVVDARYIVAKAERSLACQ